MSFAEPFAADASSPIVGSPLIGELMLRIVEKNPLQRSFVAQVAEGRAVTRDDLTSLEKYVAYAIASGQTLDELAAAYDQIVRDTLREQIYFKRNGRYRYSRFDDVASSVYFDPAYMSRYMHGLAITSFCGRITRPSEGISRR